MFMFFSSFLSTSFLCLKSVFYIVFCRYLLFLPEVMLHTAGILIISMVVCCCQAEGGSVRRVVDYIGNTVILPSGMDPMWKLYRVQWFIYKNTTFIATLNEGTFVNKYWKYKDRLRINTTTGDLEIKNLKPDDSLKYTVKLRNASGSEDQRDVVLTVRKKPRNPNIRVLSSTLSSSFCTVVLTCTAKDSITLSWNPEQGFSGRFLSGRPTPNSNETLLWTSFSPNRNVTFYCTASDGYVQVNSQHTVKCQENTGQNSSCFAPWIFAFIVVIVVIVVMVFKDKILKFLNAAFQKS